MVIQAEKPWPFCRLPRQVHGLSAYEFTRHYRLKQASHPLTAKGLRAHAAKPEAYHAHLTTEGAEKVGRDSKPKLVAGLDYQIREGGGTDWIPLGQGEFAQPYRHDWVIMPRPRPHVPVNYGAQGSKSDQEQAMRLLVLFFPWVNDARDASLEVPFLGSFWHNQMRDWRHALRARVHRFGFPTEEVKRYVLDFCSVYFLPRGLGLESGLAPNSDNEEEDDVLLVLDEDDMAEATLTHVRGAPKRAQGQADEADETGCSQDVQEGDTAATALHDLTMQMFRLSESIWLPPKRLGKADPGARMHHEQMQAAGIVRNHDQAYKAAKASRATFKNGGSSRKGLMGAMPGSVDVKPPVTKAMLQGFLESERVRRHCNPKQLEFLEVVVDRIMVEAGLISKEESIRRSNEPLLWLLHGPPGTGKSHVLGFLRELFDVMGYVYGLDYEVAAFQAVNAADLQGRTLHNAFGFDQPAKCDPSAETAKRMANWRFLIIDEISLTDAVLLAKAEQRLRSYVPAANEWKHGPDGRVRPFAGLNIIFTGDFHQLPPPAGAYLADIPSSFADPAGTSKASENAMADYGKELLWDAVQGVTELTDRERCKDEWWNEVVDELRAGRLSEANYRYLHGLPVEGCTCTPEERASRQRVITDCDDPRLQEDRFKEAPVIVANNDARYQINKDRAKWFSQAAGAPLRWAFAIDKASSEVLQAETCDKAARTRRGEEEANHFKRRLLATKHSYNHEVSLYLAFRLFVRLDPCSHKP